MARHPEGQRAAGHRPAVRSRGAKHVLEPRSGAAACRGVPRAVTLNKYPLRAGERDGERGPFTFPGAVTGQGTPQFFDVSWDHELALAWSPGFSRPGNPMLVKAGTPYRAQPVAAWRPGAGAEISCRIPPHGGDNG